jgi:hypothetical protein
MSHTETHIGTIKPLAFRKVHNTLEKKAEYLCKVHHLPQGEWSYNGKKMTWLDTFLEHDHFRDKYVVIGDDIWLLDDRDLGDEGFEEGTLNEDGSISYAVQFYNGGACLSEVLGDVVEQVKGAHEK